MDDFFGQVRSNLTNRSEPEFNKKDWQTLAKRIDNLQTDGKPPYWWGSVAALGAILIISNILWWIQWQKQQDSSYVSTHSVDTVYVTQIVYKDTSTQIDKNKNSFRHIANPQFATASYSSSPGLNLQYPYIAKTQNELNRDQNLSSSRYLVSNSIIVNRINSHANGAWTQSGIIKPVQLFPDYDLNIPRASDPKPNRKKYRFWSTVKKSVSKFSPQGLQLGLDGGPLLSLYDEGHSGVGYQTGLIASTKISRRLQVQARIAYLNFRFEAKGLDETPRIPTVSPPSDDYQFIRARVPIQALQYDIGLNYLFRTRHKLRPLVGAGFSFVHYIQESLVYKFRVEDTGAEWISEESRPNPYPLSHHMYLKVGLDYRLNKKLNWHLHLNYRENPTARNYASADMLQLSWGLRYRLGR